MGIAPPRSPLASSPMKKRPGPPHKLRRRELLKLLPLAFLPACARSTERDGQGPISAADPLSHAAPALEAPFASTGTGPFTLGVASGDPRDDRVMLWTRLAADPMVAGGEMPATDLEVEWILATDPELSSVVRRGKKVAMASQAHVVRVDVDGLSPSTTYYYAFRYATSQSTVGRTRTLPARGDHVAAIRFAVASCQNWQEGRYTAHRHLAEEDVDFVLFLGDYIYEEGIAKDAIRPHESDELETLDDYRRRYALYKTDPNLQAAHAAHPWIAIWDDHEVAQNYAGTFAIDKSAGDFLTRRASAYEAYWENLPLRAEAPTAERGLQVYRDFSVGDLAHIAMLDGRQFKSKLVCDGAIRSCDDRLSPQTSMLGAGQEKWLAETLRASRASWKLVGNNVMMAPFPFGAMTNNDQWDGFVVERQRLLSLFREIPDVVVFTGDVHATVISELPLDPAKPDAGNVGVEIVTTALSSRGANHGLLELLSRAATVLPQVKDINAKDRGYLVCELTHDELRIALRAVSTVEAEEATVRTTGAWRVARGSRHVDVLQRS